MKATELMIGDLVRWNYNIEKIREIIDYGKGQYIINGEWKVGEDCDDICEEGMSLYDLEPIPLTPEILEKNGFGRSNTIYFHTAYKYKDPNLPMYVGIEMPNEEIGFHFSFDVFGYFCHYVHELQHYIRIHGFNDLADNFKI